MRFKLGIPSVAWPAFSVTAMALAALCAGCDSGDGGGAAPESTPAVQAQQENLKKITEQASAAAKKTGATVKFGGKPGAVGGK